MFVLFILVELLTISVWTFFTMFVLFILVEFFTISV
jgi:hypothetical protein